MIDINAYYNTIKDKTAAQLAALFFDNSDSVIKDFNAALRGRDVKDDITRAAMIINEYMTDIAGMVAEAQIAHIKGANYPTEYELGNSADTFTSNGIYYSSVTPDYPNGQITGLPFQAAWLDVTRALGTGNIVLQVLYPWHTENGLRPMMRVGTNNKDASDNYIWRDWVDFMGYGQLRKINYVNTDWTPGIGGISADTLKNNGVYYSSKTTDCPDGQIYDLPFQPAWLEVTRALGTGNVVMQVARPYNVTLHHVKMRTCRPNNTWTDWVDVGGGSGSGTVINNIIQNTYNVTATPSITGGYPYILTATGTTADRTDDIAAMLEESGVCHLGTGTFYVKNLTMPDGSSIIGSGIGKTTLRLIDDATNECYAVGVRTRCSISDVRIDGGESARPTTLGLRHGISYQGTYIDSTNPGTYPVRGQIYNVDIKGFSGSGIICTNTSGNTASGINVVNANVYACYYGITIKNRSEYHRFTNVSIVGCTVGVLNNGGNNNFVNCGINSNQTGFVIDNADGTVYNDSHGSAVGCSFNHTGGNTGTAISINGATNGYVFSGCQLFYGVVTLVDSVGVQFNSCNMASVEFDINGGGVYLFNGNIFKEEPDINISNTPVIKYANNYLYDGTEVEFEEV